MTGRPRMGDLVAARVASADAAVARARELGGASVEDVQQMAGDVSWLAGEVTRLSEALATSAPEAGEFRG